MNTGYILAALGIVGIVVGGVMYATGWHHTIGIGGLGLGVVLVIVGVWLSRGSSQKTGTMAPS